MPIGREGRDYLRRLKTTNLSVIAREKVKILPILNEKTILSVFPLPLEFWD
jgi:hypothetical protein